MDILLPAQALIVMFLGRGVRRPYNEAYAPTIGDKHPRAFGRPARENWGELWNDLEPLLRRVPDGGKRSLRRTVPSTSNATAIRKQSTSTSYSPVRDEERRVRGVLCIVNETTDRMKFESALQASEERMRAIFSQSAAGIVQTDLRGHLLLVNNRFCEILGYSESELLSMRMPDICVAGDIAEAGRLFKTMAERGQSFEMESRLLRRNGTLVWVASSVSSLRDGDGSFQQATAIIVDISERKRAGRRASLGRDYRCVQRCHPCHPLRHGNHALEHWRRTALRIYG